MGKRLGIQSSPFLPALPAVALGDLGRVKFPGTTRAGRGLLSIADRDPNNPANTVTATGPSSYTRRPVRLNAPGLHALACGTGPTLRDGYAG